MVYKERTFVYRTSRNYGMKVSQVSGNVVGSLIKKECREDINECGGLLGECIEVQMDM